MSEEKPIDLDAMRALADKLETHRKKECPCAYNHWHKEADDSLYAAATEIKQLRKERGGLDKYAHLEPYALWNICDALAAERDALRKERDGLREAVKYWIALIDEPHIQA